MRPAWRPEIGDLCRPFGGGELMEVISVQVTRRKPGQLIGERVMVVVRLIEGDQTPYPEPLGYLEKVGHLEGLGEQAR
jgi:hypothetical protein